MWNVRLSLTINSFIRFVSLSPSRWSERSGNISSYFRLFHTLATAAANSKRFVCRSTKRTNQMGFFAGMLELCAVNAESEIQRRANTENLCSQTGRLGSQECFQSENEKVIESMRVYYVYACSPVCICQTELQSCSRHADQPTDRRRLT